MSNISTEPDRFSIKFIAAALAAIAIAMPAGADGVRKSSGPVATTAPTPWGRLHLRALELMRRQDQLMQALQVANEEQVEAAGNLGPAHPDVATAFLDMARIYIRMGEFKDLGIPYFRRCLEIREATLGPMDPDVAEALYRFGSGYLATGDTVRAEPLLQRSLDIREAAFNPFHPAIAESLNALARIYFINGEYARSESYYLRGIKILELAKGPLAPDLAPPLENLATLYEKLDDTGRAELLLKRSVDIRERTPTPLDLDLANSLARLGSIYIDEGNPAKADPILQRSLKIYKDAPQFDTKDPHYAQLMNILANLYVSQHDYARANSFSETGLAINREIYQHTYPVIAANFMQMAANAWKQQDMNQAIRYLDAGTNLYDNDTSHVMMRGSEAQKRAYTDSPDFKAAAYLAISMHLQGAPASKTAARLAATVELRRKGIVFDEETSITRLLRRHVSPADQSLMDQLSDVRLQLSRLARQGSGRYSADEDRQRDQLVQRQQELEATLSERTCVYRGHLAIENVQKGLPKDAALVEWVIYRPYDATASRKADEYGAPRYAAFVLKAKGDPQWADLGPAAEIDALADQLHDAMANPGSGDMSALERKLYDRAWGPLAPWLADSPLLLVSPDGELNRVPLAALRDEHGDLLLEHHTLSYQTSGRTLAGGMGKTSTPRMADVIMAAPDFDSRRVPSKKALQLATAASAVPAVSRSVDWKKLVWSDLPGTREEAAAISRLLPQAQVLTAQDASVQALENLHGPRLLHIATHSFVEPNDASRMGRQENPLLRSGLVLAGVNKDNGDGVLTALQAAGLDLEGTQLVVLSACETGAGDVSVSEGVYGLRRAFAIAGAQSQVASLWKVDDDATKDLMVDFYQRLLKKEGRAEALRQAQLAMAHSEHFSHPFFWAAFIPIGRWEPME